VYVREWGAPDGHPLVFWHALGAGTSGAYLTELAPTLTDAGLRLIAPDAPGFGRSAPLPAERYAMDSLLGLLRGVLDERGIERAILMGHSWGGTIVMAFAAAEPERVEGLVLLDTGQMDYQDQPSFPHGKSLDELIEAVRAPERQIQFASWEAFEADVQQEVRRPLTPELLEALKAGIREQDGELVGIVTPEVRGAVMHGIMQVRVTETWPAIADAGIPVLLLLATEPDATRVQNEQAAPIFAARFPGAEIHRIENAGHDLIADAGPEVARLVRDWAAGI
jgi:pimeloyl-ACP methyl ester carboxylesterase